MKQLIDLLTVLDRLLHPELGCPWDKEQTMLSMRASVLEETCELIEAIDLNDAQHIEEELGDLLFNAIFLCRLAEKEGKSSLQSALANVTKKLIHRHPHIFGSKEVTTSEQVLEQWDEIKSKDHTKSDRTSTLDGIPKGLPALARAQKMIKKMRKNNFSENGLSDGMAKDEELQLGEKIYNLISDPIILGKRLDAEQALKRVLALQEEAFRKYEQEVKEHN